MMLSLFAVSMILGTVIGSFLSMLIHRLHFEEKGIISGRSMCPMCKHTLKAKDLIPLVSYLALGGKCRYCKKKMNLWYPIMELTSALTFGALFLYTLDPLMWLGYAFLFTVLLFIFFYDLQYKEIHDVVMIPSIIVAFILSFWLGDPVSSLIGAGIGIGFFGLQFVASRGKMIGSGDMRIGAFMGLMLGWQLTILAITISYILGSIIGVALLVSKKADRKTAVPLGPFLVMGTTIAFFWGEKLLEWYFNLLI